ncbi:MAG: VWA domain-containing protein [Nitrospiraceae bacterium]|nr:VWA domain-containing protein [Nitrospiraceae bacterium]
MTAISKIVLFAIAGALGGSAAWAFVISLSTSSASGLVTEMTLGSLAGMFIGAFLWSHELIAGRQYQAALKRAAYGAAAGLVGGALGAALGNTAFAALGTAAADAGGFKASLGVGLAVALGWAILGAFVGVSGGAMIRSGERALYGLFGGALGGLLGGLMLNDLSATSIWSTLGGLMLLGLSIGAFVSLVEEAFVSAKLKVIKGRHLNREFPILKEMNVVGRDDRSDVCLSGAEGVGMQHAFIRRKNGHFSIEADKDGKVVYVNQKLTRSSTLDDGDVIRVGSILLMFSAMKKAAIIAGVVLFGVMTLGGRTALAADPAAVRISQFDLSSFPEVKAYVSVLDAFGKPVRGLDKDGITLRENDHPVSIDAMQMYGASGKPEPISMAIVVDRSGSMAGEKIERAKESVLQFLQLMEPADRAALITFSDTVDRTALLTADINQLQQATETIKAGGHTALFDALAAGVEAVQGVPGRRAVILLTDGIANRGALDINEAVAAAINENVSVYVIGLGKDVRAARLEGIAEQTGGFYFFTPSADGLSEIYDVIGKRIRNEYVITYRTEKRADYLRNVTLELASGQQATRAYFQPESSLFGAAGKAPGWAFGATLASILGLVVISLRKVEQQQYETGHLSLVRGQATKKDIDISSAVTIGRKGLNTLGLYRDSSIEEHHAQVIKEGSEYIIEDKGTRGGTFVNKQKVTGRQVLQDGDVIDVGKTTIVFSSENKRTCTDCGSPVKTAARFCLHCGAKAA